MSPHSRPMRSVREGAMDTSRGTLSAARVSGASIRNLFLGALLIAAPLWPFAVTAMNVGAARVDITPDAKALPKGYEGINDPIFVRAVVIDDGKSRAALVTVDAGAIPTDTWTQVSRRAAAELRIPTEHLLLTATHTHSVPFRNS